ncbi:hypothetical protein [Variovorax sp. Sphag1AA]|uniref:hypothetical protein n=1 Tax=Variovorax sp. Sphag1AA TaxID=2587027 RepID=UPI001608D6E5|nr:hypothetical protein [Variovorax sp. Sphag1AA]MBB3181202.1 hypothetical protein [Variovorax sp. Sphag1AA]
MADALGFCHEHSRGLLAEALVREAAAPVFASAIRQTMPLLSERSFGDAKFQQVYFSAAHACPACTFERRAVGRHAGRVSSAFAGSSTSDARIDHDHHALCISHFRCLARNVEPEHRILALGRYLAMLERESQEIQDLESIESAGRLELEDEDAAPKLRDVLRLVAEPFGEATFAPSCFEDVLPDLSDLAEFVTCMVACPVCIEVERARRRWLETVRQGILPSPEMWLFLPTCAHHVSVAAALGETALVRAVVAHSLRVALEQLQQQLRSLVSAAESEAELAAARAVKWGRRRRRKKTDPPIQHAPRIARCPACERLAVAELQATARLLKALRVERHRRSFERGYGCA